MSNNQVKRLTIGELCNKNEKYIIPIYQRNYAWGKDEIELLIQDISEAKKDKNYYIGSLVVAKRENGYEVIDGQQRLTTLKLLLSYYGKSDNINLEFEHRDESNHSLKKLSSDNNSQKNSIEHGFEIIKAYKNKLSEEIKDSFLSFLLKNVIILRIEVPKDTDLNHYFEIMNNRGEQLEHHEVLKARLMSFLDNKDKENNERKLFALIWDACSDMSVYAIKRFPYSNDNKSIRTEFFGDLCDQLPAIDSEKNNNFGQMLSIMEELRSNKSQDNNQSFKPNSMLSLLGTNEIYNKDDEDFIDGKFNSLIDFPNFLMIVLKIFNKDNKDRDISLNDKFLLNSFEYLTSKEDIKAFIICLLKCRLIFDRYVIKTKDTEDGWILNGIKKYKYKNKKQYYFSEVNTFGIAFKNKAVSEEYLDNETGSDTCKHNDIVQILSMFHVSFRQKINKNWLFDILDWLYREPSLEKSYELEEGKYLNKLEEKAYEYYKERKVDEDKIFLEGGQSTPHYIFNYLDYLLWKNWDEYLKNNEFIAKNQFRFSLSRTSIEHYLAQKRAPDGSNVHNFGNLCLISPHQNSALSDYETTTKRSFYQGASKRFDCMSLKQAIMLSEENWTVDAITTHCEEMKKLLDTKPSPIS